MNELQPNLFLLGLPKCGTSTVFNQLCNHSAIVGTSPKETFMLIDSGSKIAQLKQHNNWGKYIPTHAAQSQYLLEGTTHTIFQKAALDYFKINLESKGLVVLRDPAQRIYSSFQFSKYNLGRVKSSITFRQYVEDLFNETKLDYVNNDVSSFVLSNELKYSKYENVLAPWQMLIKEGRVKIILFEALLEKPDVVYNDLFEWLVINPETVWGSTGKNITMRPKSRILHHLAIAVNKKVHNWKIVQPLKERYKSKMRSKQLMSDDDRNAMDLLRKEFKTTINVMQTEFGLDTSCWK